MPQINRRHVADRAVTVTPSDAVDLPSGASCGLWVSVGGTLSVDTGGGNVSLGTVPVGYIPLSVTRVRATGTTATVLALI